MLAKSNTPAALLAPVRRLPLRDAMYLHDALRTISDVVSGLHCQPRFKACDIDRARNAAGLELDEWVSAIEFRMDQLVDDAAAASIPGCMAVAPAAASICKAAPYVPAPSPEPDPVFASIARWRPLQTRLDAAVTEGDFEQDFMPAQRALSAIYETEPTTPEGVLAILVVMREQESVHLDIEKFENCCDDLHRGLWRVMRAAERLLTGSVQS